ncbi:HutD family protein [Acidovorax temperans]|jgi:hypothetical protein|uniref:HutD/Ves family protein n=1 Tax=Acidovorax temperans TaxID=80878 RepID=UPI0028A1CA4A|nr:HutD family protein [Acidovorax temperans]
MTLQFFDLANMPATPWKNGGGSTRELVCWPPATAAAGGMDSFGWRVSVATIAAPGPFSAFAGVDRQIMLLGGDGVQLTSSGWQHTLAERWQPFAFSGDEAVDCTMLGGISTDFNLMLRRGVWDGTLQVVRSEPPPTGAGLCMVLQGRWQTVQAGQAARVLTAGQGAWWLDAAPPRLQPVRDPGSAEPVLAFVALERVAS